MATKNELIDRVQDIALAEVGYKEKETYDQLDDPDANAGDENYTKYQRDLAKVGYFNSSKKGVAWCAVFACWPFFQAFGEDLAKKLLCQPNSGNCGAGCESQKQYYLNAECFWLSGPERGDQILFWNSDRTESSHTGLVYKVDKTYVYTVEGNTSSGSGVIANGGEVAKKRYKLNNARIAGYGRPRWEIITEADIDIPGIDKPVEEEKEPVIETEPVEIPGMVTGNAWVHVTKGTTVNYRTKPNKSAPRVTGMERIKNGEQVYIKTSTKDWAAVEYQGFRGYVMMEFLRTDSPSQEIPSQETTVIEEPKVRTYTAVQGDTLWSISKKFYGTGTKYKKIMDVNGKTSTFVKPGMELVIPK